jgi:hypothetical protein
MLSAGSALACGLTSDARIECWGSGKVPDGEEVGLQTDDSGDVPPGRYTTVRVGNQRTCGIDTAQQASCWGRVTSPF